MLSSITIGNDYVYKFQRYKCYGLLKSANFFENVEFFVTLESLTYYRGFMSISEVVNDLKHHLDSRIKSPFTGAFSLGLILRNWDLLILIFSGNMAPLDRISSVTSKAGFLDHAGLAFDRFIISPFIFTLIYFLVFPLLNALFLWLSLQTQRGMIAIRRKVEPGMYLSIEESNKQRKRERKFREEAQSYIVEKDKEIEEIQEELDKVTGNWESSRGTVDALWATLPDVLNSAADPNFRFSPELEEQLSDTVERINDGVKNLQMRGGSIDVTYDLRICVRVGEYVRPFSDKLTIVHESVGSNVKMIISI